MTAAHLGPVDLPDFGMPARMPELPADLYAMRLQRFRELAEARGYDRVVVYADREHCANLSYLTGFDPRFEEAMAILGADDQPAILVGNECFGLAGAAPVGMRRHYFQDFSLPSQPRNRSKPLAEILGSEGIERGTRVGLVGWKDYGDPEAVDLPAYIVDEIRTLVGANGVVVNATDLLINAADGLRVINEVEQLAAF
ncbi:MAG TPA: aminopeptidase P family N-terminal domain-containing protein, partial [Acidimicrobiia bacterium]